MVQVVLNAIVRNESAVIGRMLRAALPYVCAAVIVDTGSTDNTVDVIRAVAVDELGFPADRLVVLHRPFDNFAESRTYALRMCEEHGRAFGATHALLLDADMVLVVNGGIPPNRRQEEVLGDRLVAAAATAGSTPQTTMYFLQQRLNGEQGLCIWFNARIVPLFAGLTYVGSTHEVVVGTAETPRELRNVFFSHESMYIHDVSDGGCKERKLERDLYLLESFDLAEPRNLAFAPDESRTYFYAANSAKNLAEVLLRRLVESPVPTTNVFDAYGQCALGKELEQINALRRKAMHYYRMRLTLDRGNTEEKYVSVRELLLLMLLLAGGTTAKYDGDGDGDVWQWQDVQMWAHKARERSPNLRLWSRQPSPPPYPDDGRLMRTDPLFVSEIMRLLHLSREYNPRRLECVHIVMQFLVNHYYTARGDDARRIQHATCLRDDDDDDPYPLFTQAAMIAMPALRAHRRDPDRMTLCLFAEKPVYDLWIYTHFVRMLYYYNVSGFPCTDALFVSAREAFRRIFAYPYLGADLYLTSLFNLRFYPDVLTATTATASSGSRVAQRRVEQVKRVLALARREFGKVGPFIFLSKNTVVMELGQGEEEETVVLHVSTRRAAWFKPHRRRLPVCLRKYQRGLEDECRLTALAPGGVWSCTRAFREPWIQGVEDRPPAKLVTERCRITPAAVLEQQEQEQKPEPELYPNTNTSVILTLATGQALTRTVLPISDDTGCCFFGMTSSSSSSRPYVVPFCLRQAPTATTTFWYAEFPDPDREDLLLLVPKAGHDGIELITLSDRTFV